MIIVNMQPIARREERVLGRRPPYTILNCLQRFTTCKSQILMACSQRIYCLLPIARIIFANPDKHDNFAGMQIILNNEPMTLDGESISVGRLLELKKYTFRLRIVKINGRIIDRDSYDLEMIHDGDTVQVIYLMSGG